ncbi:MAG: helix-turn-helix domain-containing protein [Candidatus Paracaedibacter sp.]
MKYTILGSILAQARLDAGFQTQRDLASLISIKQQTISRWEAGQSRPHVNQLATIAKPLNLDRNYLLELAGYVSPTIVSYDLPFPVDQLSPETFERFVLYLVNCIHGGVADVRREGISGHKQYGIDVIATLPNGVIHTFQCKRHKQFGPAQVAKVVAEHALKADVKHLVLSRVASPETAKAVEKNSGWKLWDKEILSLLIRTCLSEDDQNRLVDIFFHGRRRELLGRSEHGPWMTVEEFFKPFEGRAKTFSHTFNLKGRTKEIADLTAACQLPNTPLILLTGSGGI